MYHLACDQTAQNRSMGPNCCRIGRRPVMRSYQNIQQSASFQSSVRNIDLHQMSDDDPITLWIAELRDANDEASVKLWNHFVKRLTDSARRMLGPRTRRVYDEDDVAVSAFHSLFAGIADGRFPDLRDRESLWSLLLAIASRKVAHRQRHDFQQRRDVRRTLFDSVFANGADDSAAAEIQHVPSREPTPEFAAAFVETCDSLFQSLDDPNLQEVAALRMEGYKDSEIANHMSCARSTVQRRLEIIRRSCQHLENSGE